MNKDELIGYTQLPLFAHKFLSGIPMTSLYRLDLNGGRKGMTLAQIKHAIGFDTGELKTGNVTKFLFWLRGKIGRIFGWDDDEKLSEAVSFIPRLTAKETERSQIEPGTKEGISRVLYCFDNEFAAEIVNRTVHCFWVMAKEQTDSGYHLYTAVYVRKLNWFTPIYMALVTPMLKWIIYPALNRSVLRSWAATHQPTTHHMATV